MKRKILLWEDVTTVEWFPVLECGHDPFKYDGGLSEETMKKYGDSMDCHDCEQAQKDVERLELELSEAKKRVKP